MKGRKARTTEGERKKEKERKKDNREKTHLCPESFSCIEQSLPDSSVLFSQLTRPSLKTTPLLIEFGKVRAPSSSRKSVMERGGGFVRLAVLALAVLLHD